MSQQADKKVWVPLSVRRRMHIAMTRAKAGQGVDQRWAELEAALDAMQPFLVRIHDAPESILTQPTDDSDGLENDRA